MVTREDICRASPEGLGSRFSPQTNNSFFFVICADTRLFIPHQAKYQIEPHIPQCHAHLFISSSGTGSRNCAQSVVVKDLQRVLQDGVDHLALPR